MSNAAWRLQTAVTWNQDGAWLKLCPDNLCHVYFRMIKWHVTYSHDFPHLSVSAHAFCLELIMNFAQVTGHPALNGCASESRSNTTQTSQSRRACAIAAKTWGVQLQIGQPGLTFVQDVSQFLTIKLPWDSSTGRHLKNVGLTYGSKESQKV